MIGKALNTIIFFLVAAFLFVKRLTDEKIERPISKSSDIILQYFFEALLFNKANKQL